MRAAVNLAWPQELDRLWNSESTDAPAPGEHDVHVRIGHGLALEPDKPRLKECVEEPVLRQQKAALSSRLKMTIPEVAETAGTTEQTPRGEL